MPAEVVTVGFCPQYFATFEVQGSKGAVHTVVLNGAEHAPHCTCPAFQFSGGYGDRDCKHVRLVWDHACLWNPQWKDAGPNDLDAHGVRLMQTHEPGLLHPCPGCGQPTVPVKIAV